VQATQGKPRSTTASSGHAISVDKLVGGNIATTTSAWYERPGIAVGFNALSAVAGSLSAFLAYRAVRATLEAMREVRLARTVSKKEAYFTRFITERALPAVDAFIIEALGAIDTCLRNLADADPNAGFEMVCGFSQETADRFYSALSKLRGQLFFVTAAWPDPSLWNELDKQLLELEDEGMKRIDALVALSGRDDGIENIIRQKSADLLRLLLEYDEAQHQVVLAAQPTAWKRVRKGIGAFISGR
jgi:hypothetical protein